MDLFSIMIKQETFYGLHFGNSFLAAAVSYFTSLQIEAFLNRACVQWTLTFSISEERFPRPFLFFEKANSPGKHAARKDIV